MRFDVHTISADNRASMQTVEAQNEAEARAQIAALGLVAGLVRPAGSPLFGDWAGSFAGGPRFAVELFSQELLALLNAGLSLVEALEALQEKEAQDGTRGVLTRLLGALREGKRFSSALAEQAQVFSLLYVGMVRTAEGTSDLPRALARFIEYQQRLATLRNKIVSAAIYPAILLLVGGSVSTFLICFVVPRFAEVYQGTGRSLPWMSQMLLNWGQFAAEHAASVSALALLMIAALTIGVRHVVKTRGVAALLALIPGVGERIRVYELSRLYLALGMLLEGGIVIVQAMQTVDATVSPRLQTALRAARAQIEAGMPFSHAFEAQQLTTPISLRMLRVGERTGEMGSLLMQSAAFYDGEISRWIDRFTRTFEPLLMAVIGLVVGAIVVMLYMPIFDLAGNM
ncbi:type II secretion system F family protein [Paucibacter sp. TC2R-5]|uniref:type II secretion system F family protein n=1 Tax=Paucibacter sp. TC2R-5 TaxID=2893555 RepID=UPI0021E4DEED|nr:type II secretion system F family protein [Paucibacter sp. TC2R-5]MCV2359138.1 type II secretion system F family protein [Paucibacter sp. TC2R-5]